MQDPTVYVVDDDADMRDALRRLLRTVGLRCVGFPSAEEFLRGFREAGGPACLVLDVRMPGMSGLDLFEELARRGVGLPVLFVTAYADVPMAVRAMKSGAAEFIEKPFNGQALIEKIQRALRDDAARRAREAAAEGLRARLASLTAKEREVLGMIQDGRPNREIAARLDVTPRAVELRRASLMKKLGARSLIDLLRLTIGHDAGRIGRHESVNSSARPMP
jgi:FixJ family two-component response regulator